MPFINQPSGVLSGVTVSGTAASGQVPVASSSSAAAWKFPPGFEINYTQITASVNVTDTAENTATALISPGAITFDGTAVMVEFYSPGVLTPSATSVTDFVAVTLFEGATEITQLGQQALANLTTGQKMQNALYAQFRFTPTAASHTYKVCAFTNSTTGTPVLAAGLGGTGAFPPAFVRFTKV